MADNSFRRSSMMTYEEQQQQAMTTMYRNAVRRSSTPEPQTEALMNHKLYRTTIRRFSTPEPQTGALMTHMATHPSFPYNFSGAEQPVGLLMLQSVPVDAESVMVMDMMFMPNMSNQLLSKEGGDPMGVSPDGFSCRANNLMGGGSSAGEIVLNDEEPVELDSTLKLAPPRFSQAILSNGSGGNDLISGRGIHLFGVRIGESDPRELDLTLRLDLPGTSQMKEVEPVELDLSLSL